MDDFKRYLVCEAVLVAQEVARNFDVECGVYIDADENVFILEEDGNDKIELRGMKDLRDYQGKMRKLYEL